MLFRVLGPVAIDGTLCMAVALKPADRVVVLVPRRILTSSDPAADKWDV